VLWSATVPRSQRGGGRTQAKPDVSAPPRHKSGLLPSTYCIILCHECCTHLVLTQELRIHQAHGNQQTARPLCQEEFERVLFSFHGQCETPDAPSGLCPRGCPFTEDTLFLCLNSAWAHLLQACLQISPLATACYMDTLLDASLFWFFPPSAPAAGSVVTKKAKEGEL
jgi:hypothetical protein